MIELHGWITIRETYKATFEEEDNLDCLVEEIYRQIENLSWFKPRIQVQNGEYFINFTIFCNRKNPEIYEVFQLFNKIGKIAEGSYGLIYLYDDEDVKGKENQFQVFSLARGIVKEYNDQFLSPIIPTIEDKDEIVY